MEEIAEAELDEKGCLGIDLAALTEARVIAAFIRWTCIYSSCYRPSGR